MLDHIGLIVRSLAVSKAFYEPVLASLGYGIVVDQDNCAAYGPEGMPLFWIYPLQSSDDPTPIHLAFVASGRVAVDAFHRTAVDVGGTDNGAPGLRPEYHPNYYGAFVLDPDGNNIEAVCHDPE